MLGNQVHKDRIDYLEAREILHPALVALVAQVVLEIRESRVHQLLQE